MSGSCQEALPVVREWSGSPLECPVVVGRPSWMFGSCRVSLLDVREALPVVLEHLEALSHVREWSGHPPGCLGVVGRPTLMTGSGHLALPEVGRYSRMSGSGWLALPEVLKWSGGPP